MELLKKYKRELTVFLVLSVFYFALRLYNLINLPIFTDEAIYMRWAQIALHDSSWRFISLTDGKQPLFIWLSMVFMKFIKDPLLAGRIVSVLAGFFTMTGMFFLTNELFKNKKIAFISCLLYICYPFAQVYDRMALMDGMVGTFAVWALYFSILLIRNPKLDTAYTLGFVIGGGILTKTSDFFSIYLLPFTLVLFPIKEKRRGFYFFKWVVLAVFAVLLSQVLYTILRLSPFFGVIAEKNANFVYPFSQWVHHPFTFFIGNFNGLLGWLLAYLKLPYIILIAGSLVLLRRDTKEKILLFLYFILPFSALALFGRIIFPRFIYFMSLSLIPLAGWFLFWLIEFVGKRFSLAKSHKIAILAVLVLIFAFYPCTVSFQFAQDPVTVPIANSDSNQYVNNWTAGWGVRQGVDFFLNQAENHKIFIAAEGTFGLLPESMELYLVYNPNITIRGFWPIKNSIPKEVIKASKAMDTYFIFYQPCPSCAYPGAAPSSWRKIKLLKRYRSDPFKNSYFSIYKVNP
ncbi:glycosyltransferase family 39 protein [Patescibacteria group bacterium]|nr:glycosyltransferase family 39 protein [Patescibacteria group bacterium]